MIPEYLKDVSEFHQVEVKASPVEKLKAERAIIHYISTPDPDRVRDIMNPKGMDDSDFAKAPSVWYNHSYKIDPKALPIAKSLWRKKKDEGILTKTEFATYDFADDVYLLHEEGFINTWSIGFRPVLDKSGRIKEGSIRFDEKKGLTYWDEWYLLEYSSAPLAANINALDVVKAIQGMPLKSEITKQMIDETSFKLEVENALESFKSQLDKIQELENLIKQYSTDEIISDLEKAEKRILELEQEINSLKKQIAQPLEALDGKKVLAELRKTIIGDAVAKKTVKR